MSRATPLYELLARLERFRDRALAALSLAGREADVVEDELTRCVEAARRRMRDAEEIGGALVQRENDWLNAQRGLDAWRRALGEFGGQARRLACYFEEHWPALCAAVRSAADERAGHDAPPVLPVVEQTGRRMSRPETPRQPMPALAELHDPAKEEAATFCLAVGGREAVVPPLVEVCTAPAREAPRPRRSFGVEQIRQEWGELRWAWDEAGGAWAGPGRQRIERTGWAPLEEAIRATIEQMEHLGETAAGVLRRVC